MPARTGAEYINGLRENPPAIYIDGQQVKDVTSYPGLRNGVSTLAGLYDITRFRVSCRRSSFRRS